MKHLACFFFILSLASASFCQEERHPKKITLKVTMKDNIRRVHYGYLAGLADSGIVMVNNPVQFDHSLEGTTVNTIAYQNLSEIKIRRKGSVGRGILIGAISGMVLGGVVGLATYQKPTTYCQDNPFCITMDFGPGYNALAGASVGSVFGAAIGGIIGALAKKTFVIGGNRNKFAHMKENVLDMTYGK
jgi:hypothetical protein